MNPTPGVHPLREPPACDEADGARALRAAAGDRAALAELLEHHQSWVYAIALRMVREPADAADLAQEALIRVVTRISQFAGRASFRTWAYRIVVNCFLDAKRSRSEQFFSSFVRYGDELDRLGLAELSLDLAPGVDRALIIEETKIGCMLGMLLCLTREQRLAFILGAIFEVPSEVAGEVLGVSAAAFRKRLERARADLGSFMNAQCGLVNPSNPCRCPKKTAALIREGRVDPARLRFVEGRLREARAEAPRLSKRLEDLVGATPEDLFRGHPPPAGPDFAREILRLVAAGEIHD
jgi:RNA polymerase sigma factor (sigma-70 family)